jgi:hypothetical protein
LGRPARGDGAGKETLGASLGKQETEVGQEHQAEVLIDLRFGGKPGEGVGGAPGPVATDDLGDGEERTPIVGEAVEGAGGRGGSQAARAGKLSLAQRASLRPPLTARLRCVCYFCNDRNIENT